MIRITTHTLVKNEENWVWYTLSAWKDFADKMLVVDDASTDNTKEIIKNIKDPKISVRTADLLTPKNHTDMRNVMISQTKTDWFLLLDGDEVWNQTTIKKFLEFLKNCGPDTYAVAMRTRNCVGDIFHYQSEWAGRYELLGRVGHLTIRAYRKLSSFHWQGVYPLETYVDGHGVSLNDQPEHLAFFDGFYWHMTYLPRSSSRQRVKGWRRKGLELGVRVQNTAEFPEVFSFPKPAIVPSAWKAMSKTDLALGALLTPPKLIKRLINRR